MPPKKRLSDHAVSANQRTLLQVWNTRKRSRPASETKSDGSVSDSEVDKTRSSTSISRVADDHESEPDHHQSTSSSPAVTVTVSSAVSSSTESSGKAGSERHFQDWWLQLYPWLKYDKDKNVMWCQLCKEFRPGSCSMATGIGSNFRTSTLTRHLNNKNHLMALDAEKEQENLKVATQKALTKEEAAIQVAMKAVFWLASECIALSKYGSLIALLKHLEVPNIQALNVSDHTTYDSYNTATGLLDVLSAVIDENISKQVKDSPVLTVMCDESTDILVHQKLVIQCRVVNPVTLAPKTFFLTDLTITEATGKGIFDSIKNHLSLRGVEISKVTSLGTDGASTMTGRKEGLLGHFLRENPHISNTHCSAHRLALCTSQAANEVSAVKEFAATIEQIYYHFKSSTRKVHTMEEIQKIVNDPVLKYR